MNRLADFNFDAAAATVNPATTDTLAAGGCLDVGDPVVLLGQIIADARLVAAVIDRVTFNAHIIETGTDSYRHRPSRTRRPRSRRNG